MIVWTDSLIILGFLLGGMTGLWLWSLRIRDASIVDIFWGLGFAASAWLYLLLSGRTEARGLLLAILLTAWGLRLALHIARRQSGWGEDYRYREMRRAAGKDFPRRSLFVVFWLQAGLIWVIGAPIAAVFLTAGPAFGTWDVIATALFGAGLTIESVADWQLLRFKADPKNRGRALDRGLWRYSRHPNYFGDALLWWGIFGFAVSAGAWWTVYAPILMTVLLLKVSGVALLEKTIVERRPEYRDYMERTSAFIPWVPRKSHG